MAGKASSSGDVEPVTTTENWSDSDTHLVVTQPEGYFCNMSMLARVPLPPSRIFAILTDPENHRIFKSIKAVKSRRVVWNDGRGRQLVEVEQLGEWRFLFLRGTFTAKLLVEEDKNQHSIRIDLAQPGFMRRFRGHWVIRPFNQEAIDDLVNHKCTQSAPSGPLGRLQASIRHLQERLSGKQAEASLVQLEHSVMPSFVPPPPADRFLKRIAGGQLMAIMRDLRLEAERINSRQRSREEQGGEVRAPGSAGGKGPDRGDLQALAAHVRKL